MATQIEVFVAKSNNLNFIPRTHIVEGEKESPQNALSSLHEHHNMCLHAPIYIYTK